MYREASFGFVSIVVFPCGSADHRRIEGIRNSDAARLAQERQMAALAAATAEYRRLTPSPSEDPRGISGEVNRMIASAIIANPRWFWHGPDA